MKFCDIGVNGWHMYLTLEQLLSGILWAFRKLLCFDDREGESKLETSQTYRCQITSIGTSNLCVDTPLRNMSIARTMLPLWPKVNSSPQKSPSWTDQCLYDGNKTLRLMDMIDSKMEVLMVPWICPKSTLSLFPRDWQRLSTHIGLKSVIYPTRTIQTFLARFRWSVGLRQHQNTSYPS